MALFKKISLQLLIFFVVFNILSLIQERNMLSGQAFPEQATFTLNTTMDETVNISAVNKTTVLYFFAPWCSICDLSVNNLEQLYLVKPDIDVIAIALDYESVNNVKNFSQKHQLTFPIAVGNSDIKEHFKIQGYPSYYVLDKNNQVIAKSLGYSTKLGLFLRTAL